MKIKSHAAALLVPMLFACGSQSGDIIPPFAHPFSVV